VEPGKETSAPTASGHTQPGTVMGTVGYMSPEQVRGLPVDHRSDLFSFGAILYEMLSGQRAFKRATASDTMAAILLQEPPPLSGSGRDVSPALDHTVSRCLSKDRENRFQTARDVAFALSEAPASGSAAVPSAASLPRSGPSRRLLRVALAVAVAAAIGVGLLLVRRSGPAAPSPPRVRRVLVLPFPHLGAEE